MQSNKAQNKGSEAANKLETLWGRSHPGIKEAVTTLRDIESDNGRLREALSSLLTDYIEARKEWSEPSVAAHADDLIAKSLAALQGSD